jgi:tRNA 2-thiocytidine biosynthesis protein TtcA
MAQITEEEKTIRRIEKRFNKGIVQYGLIEEGDKVLVGLSGGKDSLALVGLLGKRSRIFKPRFSVVAVHVVMKNIPYQSDLDYLRAHAESYGVPLVVYEISFDPSTDTRKSPCFLYPRICASSSKSASCTRHIGRIIVISNLFITNRGGIVLNAP